MKKHNIIFTTLFLTLTTMPFSVSALTVSGTVKDDMGPLSGASVQTINSDGKVQKAKVTDINGRFTIDVTENAKLQVSFMGLKTQTIDNPKGNLDITLVEETKSALDKDVIVTKDRQEGNPCGANLITDLNANKEAKGKYKKVGTEWICVPNECIQNYRLEGTVCAKYQCSKEDLKTANATNGTWDKNLQTCIPVCDENNGFTRSINNVCERTKCAKSEIENLKKQDKNIDTVELDTNGNCVPKTCKNDYHFDKTKKCVKNQCEKAEEDWNGKECVKVRCSEADLETLKAKEGKWENNNCIPTKCLDDKNFKLENGSCVANDCPAKELEKLRASAGYMENNKCIPSACITDYKLENGACVNADILAEKQKAYDDAKAKEQSLANRALTAATTAATGIGGMELMRGLAEQSADKDAMADMAAYIQTMRCTYGDGKQVKAGPEEIELPGANDAELMNLRGQYLALAQDLKERKEALGMKPGIESEVIMDRASTGLYDDENVGITSGNYASLYRAQALKSETDQQKIDDAAAASKRRVTGGAIAAGAGVVGGIVGNQLINGKSNDKSAKESAETETNTENDALEKLKKCLKDGGAKKTSDLKFDNFTPSILHLDKIYCSGSDWKSKVKNKDATTLFADTADAPTIKGALIENFECDIAGKLLDKDLCYIPQQNTEPEQNPQVVTNQGQSESNQEHNDSGRPLSPASIPTPEPAQFEQDKIPVVTQQPEQGQNSQEEQKQEEKKQEEEKQKNPQQKTTNQKKSQPKQEQKKDTPKVAARTPANTNKTKTTENISMFKDVQVNLVQAKAIIKLWGEKKQKSRFTYVENSEKINALGQDYISYQDDSHIYIFEFDDLNESLPASRLEGIARAVCNINGGKKVTEPDTGLKTAIRCDDIECNSLNNDLKKLGYANQIKASVKHVEHSQPLPSYSYCRLDF